MRGKANCCSLARVQLSVLHLGGDRAAHGPATSRSSHRQLHRGSLSTSYAMRAVLVFWDGLGEDGSEDLPVRFGAAAVRRRGVGGFDPHGRCPLTLRPQRLVLAPRVGAWARAFSQQRVS